MPSNLAELTRLTASLVPRSIRQVNRDYSQVTTVTPEPWGNYPTGRLPYDQGGAIDLPAVGTESTILTFQVPTGYDGVATWYSLNFTGGGFEQGSGDIVWRIYRNNVAERNFENILTERGSLQVPRPIANLQLFSRDLIKITVTHAANVLLNGKVVGSIAGYYYPNQLS